jgi:hypothetical protein
MKPENCLRRSRQQFMRVLRALLDLAVLVSLAAMSSSAQSSADSSVIPTVPLHDRYGLPRRLIPTFRPISATSALSELDFDKEFQSYIDQIMASDDRQTFDFATAALLAKL